MTFKEYYGDFKAYQKEQAEQMLKHELEGKIYDSVHYCFVNIFEKSETYMTDKEKEKKRKKLANIERLKRIIAGEEDSLIYMFYWHKLKDTEFPSWRIKKEV